MGGTGIPTVTFHFPLPPKALSPNARVHYMARARATRYYRTRCFVIARNHLLGSGWVPGRVEIDMEYRCPKGSDGYVAMDLANAMSATKALIDGMVDAGVMPNDSRKYLTWGRMELIPHKNPMGEGVTVIVRAVR